jgi:hypothetical protein
VRLEIPTLVEKHSLPSVNGGHGCEEALSLELGGKFESNG